MSRAWEPGGRAAPAPGWAEAPQTGRSHRTWHPAAARSGRATAAPSLGDAAKPRARRVQGARGRGRLLLRRGKGPRAGIALARGWGGGGTGRRNEGTNSGTKRARVRGGGGRLQPRGGDALAAFLVVSPPAGSPVILPPPRRHASPSPPPYPMRPTALPKARMKNGNGKTRSRLPTLGNQPRSEHK